jgi:hypothetical protein
MHLQHGRGGDIGRGRESIDHLRTAKEKIPYIRDYDPRVSDERLILVATDESGPYTVIDGTHRAVALLTEHHRSPNTPWNAMLIDSPKMTENRWHIDFVDAPQIFNELADLAERGAIW